MSVHTSLYREALDFSVSAKYLALASSSSRNTFSKLTESAMAPVCSGNIIVQQIAHPRRLTWATTTPIFLNVQKTER